MVLAFSTLCTLILLAIQIVQFYGLPFFSIKGNLQEIREREFHVLAAVADSRKKLINDWVAARRRNANAIAALPAASNGKLYTDPLARKQIGAWLEEVRTNYQLDAIRFIDPKTGAVVLVAPGDAAPTVLAPTTIRNAAQPGIDESILLTLGQGEGTSHFHLIRQVVSPKSQDGRPELLLELECSLETLLKPQLELNMQGLLGKTGEIVLFDTASRFLTMVNHPLPDGQQVQPLLSKNSARPAQLAISGSEGTIEELDYRRIPVLAAYRHIQISPEMAWGMVVKKDHSEAFASLQYQRNLFLMLGLAGITATVLLAVLISYRVTHPLRRMVSTSRTISTGDLTARVPIEGDSETAELATAFNKMLDQLHTWHSELDQRVRQRTEQLEQVNHELQNEITERTKAEEALHEKAVQLEEEIGERQKAQEELEILNSSLEQRIGDTVNELRQKDDLLIQQNRMAAMGELLNNIAHQWRQPLNNIAVYIQTMQYLNRAGELTSDEMDRDIKAVMDILQYMSQTIDDFRGFFVRDRSNVSEFALGPTVAKALTIVTPALTATNIRTELLKDDREVIRVTGYPNEFAQVLINILYNARDILVEREIADPQIEIMVSREQGRAIVTVRDNGGGIAEEVLPHIFDPYFTTKGPTKGTGIGLYMSKTIIEKNMGGTLTARNTPDGAELRIEL